MATINALDATRLNQQLEFLHELDRLKSVYRASRLTQEERFENSAEHSWHIAMYAMVLSQHANEGVDRWRVVQMLLIHDIVEIDTEDQPLHGPQDPDRENSKTNGGTWPEFAVSQSQVVKRTQHIQLGSATLWEHAVAIFKHAVEMGWLKKG